MCFGSLGDWVATVAIVTGALVAVLSRGDGLACRWVVMTVCRAEHDAWQVAIITHICLLSGAAFCVDRTPFYK